MFQEYLAAIAKKDELDTVAELLDSDFARWREVYALIGLINTPLATKSEAGRILAELYNPDPTRFVCADHRDAACANLSTPEGLLEYARTGFVPIAAKGVTFTMQAGRNDKGKVTLKENYLMAKTLVTYAQFETFVADPNGYHNDAHWTQAGLAWRKDRTAPSYWKDPKWHIADDGGYLVVLAVPSQTALYELGARCRAMGIRHVLFYEPDDGMEHTALSTEPITGEVRRVFRTLPLWGSLGRCHRARGPPQGCQILANPAAGRHVPIPIDVLPIPSNGMAIPIDVFSIPSNGMAVPMIKPAIPIDVFPIPSNGIAIPLIKLVIPIDVFSIPSNGMDIPMIKPAIPIDILPIPFVKLAIPFDVFASISVQLISH